MDTKQAVLMGIVSLWAILQFLCIAVVLHDWSWRNDLANDFAMDFDKPLDCGLFIVGGPFILLLIIIFALPLLALFFSIGLFFKSLARLIKKIRSQLYGRPTST